MMSRAPQKDLSQTITTRFLAFELCSSFYLVWMMSSEKMYEEECGSRHLPSRQALPSLLRLSGVGRAMLVGTLTSTSSSFSSNMMHERQSAGGDAGLGRSPTQRT